MIRARRAALGFVLALGAGACGEATVDAPSLVALELRTAPDAAPLPERVVRVDLDLFRQAGWSATGPTPRRHVWEEGEPPLLELPGTGTRRLIRSERVDARSFDRVELEVASLHGAWIRAKRFHGDTERDESPLVWVERSGAPRTVALPFPRVDEAESEVDRIELVVSSDGPVGLAAARLVDVPFAARLPRPDDGARFLTVVGGEHDERPAVGVSTGRAVEARCDAPSGARLTFAWGFPSGIGYEEAPPAHGSWGALRVSTGLEGEALEVLEDVALAGRPDAGWRFASVDLEGGRARIERVRFEVLGANGRPLEIALAEPRVVRADAAARSVLLVTSDTHRYDHVATSHRAAAVETPALDALAARGVTFDDCFSTTNVTTPSHVAIMTGTSPRDTGVIDNNTLLLDEARTLAEAFRAAGFRTWACVSAKHLTNAESGLGQGFDRVAFPTRGIQESNGGAADAEDVVSELLHWMPEAEGAPLFVWLHLFDAHTPYAPPGRWDRRYYPRDRDPTASDAAGASPLPDAVSKAYGGVRDPEFLPSQYRAEVGYLDEQLARVLALERFRRGVVAVTADHGENLGQHGIFYGHSDLFPDSLHVPLILAWPDAPKGARVGEPVQTSDLARTLLDLAGIPSAFPGRSLASLSTSGASATGSAPRFALASHMLTASVTEGDWHLTLQLADWERDFMREPRVAHSVRLFDLAEDPACERDLVDERLDVARRLRGELVDWLDAAEPRGWSEATTWDPDELANMQALGYVEGGEVRLLDPGCDCAWCARFR